MLNVTIVDQDGEVDPAGLTVTGCAIAKGDCERLLEVIESRMNELREEEVPEEVPDDDGQQVADEEDEAEDVFDGQGDGSRFDGDEFSAT
jgi:hypothetical protein